MTEPRRLGPDDWELFRDIRLRALADAPDSFSSTLDDALAFTESHWRSRLLTPLYVVLDPQPVSVGGVFDDHGTLRVWGMWTDPGHRGRGHARSILEALLPPGRDAELHVCVGNPAARSVYERFGFVGTDTYEPLRPGSDQQMQLMVLRRG